MGNKLKRTMVFTILKDDYNIKAFTLVEAFPGLRDS